MLVRFLFMLAMVLATGVGIACGHFESDTWLWAYPAITLGFFLGLCALAFFYLLILCKRVNQDQEQELDDPWYRMIGELYIESILPMVRIAVQTRGMEKIPKEGRFVLVCNHCSNADPVLLLHCFAGHQVAFISKKENRDMFVVGKFMHKILCQLIDRENDKEALKTIIRCIKILKEDKASIGVFPEGGIAKDQKLHRFRPGVFKIAQKAQVPIVVCTLKGTKEVLRNMAHYRASDVEMHVLEVIPVAEIQGIPTTEIADRIYRCMVDDLGPENVAAE